jgi:hypothetical protein
MTRETSLRRVLPWAIAAALAGLVTGLAFSMVRDDGSSDSTSTATTATTIAVSSTALSCTGSIAPTSYAMVTGITEAGVESIASALQYSTSAPITRAEAATTKGQALLRQRVMAKASADHAVLLVLEGSDSPWSRQLARDLVAVSQRSGVIVVTPDSPSAALLHSYPTGTIVVQRPPRQGAGAPGPEWARRVADAVSGHHPCSTSSSKG